MTCRKHNPDKKRLPLRHSEPFARAGEESASPYVKRTDSSPVRGLVKNDAAEVQDRIEMQMPIGVVGDALSKNPKVALISMTGSTTAGKRIMKTAADNVTKVSLELGGSFDLGPMVNKAQQEHVDELVQSAIAEGAQVRLGGDDGEHGLDEFLETHICYVDYDLNAPGK